MIKFPRRYALRNDKNRVLQRNTMKKYDLLIFDADHTVIDFDEDERRAFRATFACASVLATDEMIEHCWEYSAQNWQDLGLNDVHLSTVQEKYHQTYYEHVRLLVDYIDKKYGLNGKTELARKVFDDTLSQSAHYIQNADLLLQELSKEYRVCIATNGLSKMQHGRLQKIKPFLSGLFISEEMGTIKPNRDFFEQILNRTGAARERCLMIGDSLSSDVAGANGAKIACVWFNRRGARSASGYQIVGEIARLEELKKFL